MVRGLGLSPRQREQIRAIEEEVLIAQLREMRVGGILGDAGDRPREPDGPGPRSMDRALAVLTADQSLQWGQMVGEPIQGQLSAFPMALSPHRDLKRRPR